MNGWIKLHRKVIDNPIFDKPELFKLFVYCLLAAGHEEKKIIWNGKEEILPKGSFITGREKLSKELKQSESMIRRNLKILENISVITRKSTNKYTVINVVNYGIYQGSDLEIDQPATSGYKQVRHITNGCTVKSTNKKEMIDTDIDELYKKNNLNFNQPATNQRPTSDQPATTNKKYNIYASHPILTLPNLRNFIKPILETKTKEKPSKHGKHESRRRSPLKFY